MTVEEQINNIIAEMYDLGYEFESDDANGVRFVDLQNSINHMTFDNWEDVNVYVNKH